MNDKLLKQVKKMIRDVNEDLVRFAEAEDGLFASEEFMAGYTEGLRQYHLELIEIVRRYEE